MQGRLRRRIVGFVNRPLQLGPAQEAMRRLESPPLAANQKLISAELHKVIEQTDAARERTDTKAGALLAAVGAIGALAGTRISAAVIDTLPEQALIAGLILFGSLSLDTEQCTMES